MTSTKKKLLWFSISLIFVLNDSIAQAENNRVGYSERQNRQLSYQHDISPATPKALEKNHLDIPASSQKRMILAQANINKPLPSPLSNESDNGKKNIVPLFFPFLDSKNTDEVKGILNKDVLPDVQKQITKPIPPLKGPDATPIVPNIPIPKGNNVMGDPDLPDLDFREALKQQKILLPEENIRYLEKMIRQYDNKGQKHQEPEEKQSMPPKKPEILFPKQRLPESISKKKYIPENRHLPKVMYIEEYVRSLFDSVAKNDTDAVRALGHYLRNLEVRDQEGNTPLIYAAMAGNLPVIYVLLGMGANQNAQNMYGVSALHVAALSGRLDIVNVLLKNNAIPTLKDQIDRSPLSIAQQKNFTPIVSVMEKYQKELRNLVQRAHSSTSSTKIDDDDVKPVILTQEENIAEGDAMHSTEKTTISTDEKNVPKPQFTEQEEQLMQLQTEQTDKI